MCQRSDTPTLSRLMNPGRGKLSQRLPIYQIATQASIDAVITFRMANPERNHGRLLAFLSRVYQHLMRVDVAKRTRGQLRTGPLVHRYQLSTLLLSRL